MKNIFFFLSILVLINISCKKTPKELTYDEYEKACVDSTIFNCSIEKGDYSFHGYLDNTEFCYVENDKSSFLRYANVGSVIVTNSAELLLDPKILYNAKQLFEFGIRDTNFLIKHQSNYFYIRAPLTKFDTSTQSSLPLIQKIIEKSFQVGDIPMKKTVNDTTGFEIGIVIECVDRRGYISGNGAFSVRFSTTGGVQKDSY